MKQKDSPSIDIFIPYWGDFSLLKQTVDSVFAQTSETWLLTILDDHYTSTEAYEYYQKHPDPRLTYIRHKQNLGITKNFNYAIGAAKAPYCMVVGCDDRLLSNYVETALQNIGDADFYQPGVEVIDANGRLYMPLGDRVKRQLMPKKSGIYSGEKLATSLCHGNWLYFPSITWKTATVQRYSFNDTYKIVEDLDLELRMIIDGAKLSFSTTPAFQYRRFAESLSSKEKGKSGVRFTEEKATYTHFATKFTQIGWKKAERAAKLHISSRINKLISR